MKDETLLSYEFDFEHYNDVAWLHAVANQPTVHGITAAILAKLAIELNKRLDSTIQSGNSAQPVTVPDDWIPVSERMPESNGVYFGWDGKRVLEVNCFFGGFSANQFIHGEITHWMPLPAAPQEVK